MLFSKFRLNMQKNLKVRVFLCYFPFLLSICYCKKEIDKIDSKNKLSNYFKNNSNIYYFIFNYSYVIVFVFHIALRK